MTRALTILPLVLASAWLGWLQSSGCDEPTSPTPVILVIGTEGADTLSDLTVTSDGNIALLGQTSGAFPGMTSFGETDVVLGCVTPGLALSWVKQLGTSGPDEGRALLARADGIVALGNVTGTLPEKTGKGDQDYFLGLFSPQGQTQWLLQEGTREYDAALGLAQDNNGNLWIAGFANPYQDARAEMLVAVVSSAGLLKQTYPLGGSSDDVALAIAAEHSGGMALAGATNGTLGAPLAGSFDVTALGLSSDGKPLWTRQWGTSEAETSEDIATGPDGSIFLLTSSYSDLASGVAENDGRRDAFLFKLDAAGNLVWRKRVTSSESGESMANVLLVSPTGDLYIAGWTTASLEDAVQYGQRDLFVRSLSSEDGGTLWTRQFGSDQDDEATALALDSNDTLWIGGTAGGTVQDQPTQGGTDMLLIRLPLASLERQTKTTR